ncbi:MAG: HAD family phosphatase [Thermomicrobiales bacterium]
MTIRAVVFDIGGVLELTPRTGWVTRWETLLELVPGDLVGRMAGVWRAGSIGTISEAEVERRTAEILGFDGAQLRAFMGDIWAEYLGTPNTELIEYFAGLRSRCKTAILSNSFVGAREREQAAYGFGDICDLIIYSHEEGMQKPDPRFYGLLVERLGVRPEEIVFLDDVELCVTGARECGIHAILFKENAQAIAEIEGLLG